MTTGTGAPPTGGSPPPWGLPPTLAAAADFSSARRRADPDRVGRSRRARGPGGQAEPSTLRRLGHLDGPLLGLAQPQPVAEGVAEAAVGSVEALGRLLVELHPAADEPLVVPPHVVGGEDGRR